MRYASGQQPQLASRWLFFERHVPLFAETRMPSNEYRFSFDELLIALLRAQGIHEGRWTLNVDFSATGTSVRAQATPTRSLPGLLISVAGATLVRVDNGAEGAVDAAVVNPPPPASPKKITQARKSSARTIQ
jgi:hypothetical protein